MKNLFLFIFLASLHLQIFAQEKDTILKLSRVEKIFLKNHFFMSLGGFVSRGQTKTISGLGEKLIPLFGLGHQLQFGYDTNFDKKNSWRFSVEIGQLPVNYDFLLLPEKYPMLDGYDFIGMPSFFGAGVVPFLSISNSWIRRLTVKRNYIFDAGVGISVRFTPAGYYSMDYGLMKQSQPYVITDKITVFRIEDNENSFNQSLQFCPQFSLGVTRILRNNNLMSLRMVYNLSFQNHLVFGYSFFPEDRFSRYHTLGEYSSRGSYLGLNLSYHFTKSKKQY